MEPIVETVKKLCQHLFGEGRRMCADNFYTLNGLVEHCKRNKTEFIGTLRKKSDLYLKDVFDEPKQRTTVIFKNNLKYVMYKNKKSSKKAVVIVSTDLKEEKLVRKKKGKPISILEYNKLKTPVDTSDRMLEWYSCSRGTRRWPMALFYYLINIAFHNSRIIYEKSGKSIELNSFVDSLCISLAQPYLTDRFKENRIYFTEKILAIEYGFVFNEEDKTTVTKGTCHKCSNSKGRGKGKTKDKEKGPKRQEESIKQKRIKPSQTTRICQNCPRYICKSHSILLCSVCVKDHLPRLKSQK